MSPHARFRYEPVEGAQALFTDRFVEYLLLLHDRFAHEWVTSIEMLARGAGLGAIGSRIMRMPRS